MRTCSSTLSSTRPETVPAQVILDMAAVTFSGPMGSARSYAPAPPSPPWEDSSSYAIHPKTSRVLTITGADDLFPLDTPTTASATA
jgi:hypothetical protein